MKLKRFFLTLFSLMLTLSTIMAQKTLKDIEGSWTGKLNAAGMELRMVFNFTMTEADTLKATLDSPDQAAQGIPLGGVKLAGDSLFVDAPMLKGNYKGSFTSDTTVRGAWTQLGKEYSLDISRQETPPVILRPQEPKPPFPYTAEDVTFRNSLEGFDLAGTLTLPEGSGPFPAVVLISGSGAQDRDETLLGHKPFLVLSDHLTRNGIAVLRYDDRGVGKSKGNMMNATSMSLAGDAEAAVTYLLSRPEIDKKMIGLAGHSEGGLIAPIVASRNSNVAFIVSLAGPGVSGYDIIIRQTRDIQMASGIPEKDIEETIKTNSKLFEMVMAEADQRKVAKNAMEWYNKELDGKGVTPEERKTMMAQFTQGLLSVNSPWVRYFLAAEPAEYWSKVKVPVLALNGEKDLQVSAEVNLPAIKASLKKAKNRKVTIKSMPGLNHLFQHSATGSPSEYASIEETFSPEVLQIITDWIKLTGKKKK
jgi:hypothetical protein